MQPVRFLLGMIMAVGVLAFPETALNAAQQAMGVWYASVAPSLFPFMALMPLLTSPYAARVYGRLLGPVMRPLFGLPGEAAPAVVIGAVAGSPAGAHAALRIAGSEGLSRTQLERLVCCMTGLSPAFLITGVGAAMLADAGAGTVLMKSQLSVQFLLLYVTRFFRDGAEALPPMDAQPPDGPMRGAVLSVLGVCGWMVIFSVAAALMGRFVSDKAAVAGLLSLLDLPSGARALADLPLEREARILLMAAATGFGGMCIAMQNISAVRGMVKIGRYFEIKLLSAALMPAAAAVLLSVSGRKTWSFDNLLPKQTLTAVFFAAPILIFLVKNLFLNKRNFEKQEPF